MVEPSSPEFCSVNGRDVLAAGERRIWRCPTCAWWRDWAETRCCGCGALRDAVDPPDPHLLPKPAAARHA